MLTLPVTSRSFFKPIEHFLNRNTLDLRRQSKLDAIGFVCDCIVLSAPYLPSAW